MTNQESEVLAMKEMAEHRLRHILTTDKTIYESVAFRRAGIGLRPWEFQELVIKLCDANFCTRKRMGDYGNGVRLTLIEQG
jgi:hypothetical protein